LDDDSLHSLLSRGGLSGAQRERALEGALRRSGTGSRRRWAWLGAGVVLPAAAALAFFLRSPAVPVSPEASWLVAKGERGPVLRATCPGRAMGECHAGDQLIFEVEGATRAGFFAAYADCAAGERIWYFPTAAGSLPEISPNGARTIVKQAARVGKEHGVGTCTLHLFALERPASRAALLSGKTEGSFQADVSLVVKP
jgi:hypothetical protein